MTRLVFNSEACMYYSRLEIKLSQLRVAPSFVGCAGVEWILKLLFSTQGTDRTNLASRANGDQYRNGVGLLNTMPQSDVDACAIGREEGVRAINSSRVSFPRLAPVPTQRSTCHPRPRLCFSPQRKRWECATTMTRQSMHPAVVSMKNSEA